MRVFRQPEFWIIIAAAAVLTAAHYSASQHTPFWHDLFRRLYYLPIILAGFRYGLRGGLVTAGAVSLVFLPHVLMTREMLHVQASETRFEIPLYLIVGAVTGVLADRQRRANQSLRRTEKLRTVGQLAAGVAHEIKNPLAAIRSSAQLLEGKVAGREAELVGIIVSEVDRLNRVVNQFLQYARPAPVRRAPCRLSEILDGCLELLAPVAARRSVALAKLYAGDDPEVPGDPDQLRQVFINLILNSIEAVPDGGRVEVGIESTGHSVSGFVRDNGPGIPGEKRRTVFEPFVTTKEGGTGLGLAVAQRIVNEHGGTLTLESGSGTGTTARVTLSRRAGS